MFHTEIVSLHETRKEAVDEEEKYQREETAVNNTLYLNECYAKGDFDTAGKTYEEIYGEEYGKFLRQSKGAITRGKPSPLRGRKRSEEVKKKLKVPKKNKENYKKAARVRAKSIACIETKEIFFSIVEAAEACVGDHESIRSCAHGKNKSAAGYTWKFLDNIDISDFTYYQQTKKTKPIRIKRKLLCIQTNKIYDLPSDAARHINSNNIRSITASIYSALRHSHKACGYTWRYITEQKLRY